MSVDFIFKIAAIGAHHPGRGDCGFDDVGAEDQRAFLRYKIYV